MKRVMPRVDLTQLDRSRIARQCVCCGGAELHSSPAILMPFVAHRAFGWEPVVIDESWGLRTIRTGNAYSICRSLWCADCQLLFLDIRFTELELGSIYREYRGEEYTALRESYEPGYVARNAGLLAGIEHLEHVEDFLLPHLSTPLTVLDWGGDTGRNTPFRFRAERVDLYDLSQLPVLEGVRAVTREEALDNRYSLIVCSHVLEHVSYPADLLRELYPMMGPETICYLEVPHESLMRTSPLEAHLRKRHWHEHINFFSEDSLRHLVGNVGLEIVAMRELPLPNREGESAVFQLACRRSPDS